MAYGFNFKTKKVEKHDTFVIQNYFMDYDKICSLSFNDGIKELEDFFETVVSNIEPEENYLIQLKLNNREFLSFDEYLELFAMFGYKLTNGKGVDNKKGYLKAKEEIQKTLMATDYTILEIMNHDYNYGIIQLQVIDSFETEVNWAAVEQND